MILTVTPNPSLDRTVFIDSLERGSVIRARRSRSEPSGKGVNIALALHSLGFGTWAVLPVGGSAGEQLSRLLSESGLRVTAVPVGGEIRTNVSLVEPDGTVTKINEPGPELTVDEITALADAVRDALAGAGADWLAASGSLPPGAPADFYGLLVELGHAAGVPVAVDTSGPPLRAVLAARPDLVTPNSPELAELVGRPLRTLGEIVDAAEEVRALGAGAVLVSLGGDGAVLVDPTGALHAEAPVARVVSAVGAGDALLAGFLSVRALSARAPGARLPGARLPGARLPAARVPTVRAAGAGAAETLATAVAWGAAAVAQEGTVLTGPIPARQVVVHPAVDRSRRLRDS